MPSADLFWGRSSGVAINSCFDWPFSIDESYMHPRGGGGCAPYNDLYSEASAERDTFFRLQVYERVRISLVEV